MILKTSLWIWCLNYIWNVYNIDQGDFFASKREIYYIYFLQSNNFASDNNKLVVFWSKVWKKLLIFVNMSYSQKVSVPYSFRLMISFFSHKSYFRTSNMSIWVIKLYLGFFFTLVFFLSLKKTWHFFELYCNYRK